jgi:hypothetical protein
MQTQKSALEIELGELYDIRYRKGREERERFEAAQETKKDIKLVTLMFADGIEDLSVKIGQQEILEWDFRSKRLIYHRGDSTLFVEGAKDDILVRIRPFLTDLVQKAKEKFASTG